MSESRVLAWDSPTRAFKWLFVAAVVTAWATDKYAVQHPEWHKWSGYGALVLVLFRVLWGFCGGSTARFSSFVTGPRTVADYVRAEVQGRRPRFLGHNPLGGWMVLALLVSVGLQAILGLFSAAGDWLGLEGPLAHTVSDAAVDWATRLHRLGFNLILALVGLHVAANIYYDVFRRAGLMRAMMTGSKPRAAHVGGAEPVAGSPWVAAACLLAAVLGIAAILGFVS